MEIISTITTIVIVIFIVLFITFVFLWEWSLLITRAPFVSVPKNIIPEIVIALKLQNTGVLYDLGCGDGRILMEALHHNPNMKMIGIEKALVPFWFAKLQTKKFKKIKIHRRNFFKQDLSDATHVFLYLFPKLMDALLPKLEKELKPGTRVVSCSFQFSKKTPVEIINTKTKNRLVGKMFVYEF